VKYENPVTEASDEYEVVFVWMKPNIEAIASPTTQMATSKFVLSQNPSALKISNHPNKPVTFGSNFKVHALSSNNNGAASSCSSREVSYFILLFMISFS